MDHFESICQELEFRCNPQNVYHQAIGTVINAAELIGMPRRIQLILAQPKNEIMTHFPVQLDDGTFKLFKGYRVQHNNVLGPFKGGIRYHKAVHLDHIKALSVLMTIKASLLNLPFGGAKGGLQVDPSELSTDELRRLTRRFTRALGDNIAPDYDIAAPDMGTNAQIMAWMADTYININESEDRLKSLSIVTGKPVEFGGIHGREEATARGLLYALEELQDFLKLKIYESSFSLVGYGNVGSWTGKLLTMQGAKMRAVIDHTGAILNEDGIHAEDLDQYVKKQGGVSGYPKAKKIKESDFYKVPVDIFIPAALEQMIDLDKAKDLKCRIIIEGANIPITGPAERYLLDTGKITILPGVLTNAGGVTVSYFEWMQNLKASSWEASVVDSELRRYVRQAISRVLEAKKKYGCDLGTAAYCASLEHIGNVYNLRGLFP